MLRATTLLLVVSLNAGLSHGMKCSFGNQNFLEKMIDSCPGLLDSSDKSYCCLDVENSRTYCCDAAEFVVKSSWVAVTVIVVVVMMFTLVVCCIACCRRHRRRHQGTIYGRMLGPLPHSSEVYAKQAPYNPNYV
ncbi:uncharacterized protein LOC122402824 isoform X2 [Colletes gigas]|uniref:uncharacterized protein LOC122402824 isoform X2 n=1 Tax=Colletes gigas TaxID=935657 RepID=UPI001C9B5EE3|nr:uncharacterized protein LOC122402824 isoform X2 [Colletes gigas]